MGFVDRFDHTVPFYELAAASRGPVQTLSNDADYRLNRD
jgi:hypothetical protein